ncbi:MAG: hypothetical protein QOJ99_5341 [Bryobacterales bacterium]|nr:hypothetical protein [Bryobacterales bacterium]
MKFSQTFGKGSRRLVAVFFAGLTLLGGAEPNDEIARLQATVAAQQKQLDTLQRMMEQQQRLLERAIGSASASTLRFNPSDVASASPVIPVTPTATGALALPAQKAQPGPASSANPTAPRNPCERSLESNPVPPYLRLGNTCIAPIGFMDLTAVWRDKNAGSGIGSNFGGVPYINGVPGNLSEFRFSPQNSRIGFRADGEWKGTHFIGYNEFDFLGTSASNGLGVTNGAFVPRLRLFWVNARKGSWEFLGGQSWSMLTPNRKGISALPGDLFYSHVIDVNYMAGLTWTRQPGVRVLYHPNQTVTLGVSLENPNQYAGGQAGAPKITPPAALASFLGTQLDDTSTGALSTPNLAPDIIVKVAFDPSSKLHAEIAGIERTFRTYNPATYQHVTKPGAGISLNANVELLKDFRVVTNNFWSDGGGRYLFGQAPDVIIRADGSLSPIHSGGTVDGLEWTIKNTLLYAYYGGIYIGRNTALDADGKSLVGYGFSGSSNTQNRAINEVTFGFNQTMWRDPRYGAINVMGQYEWLQRDPWSVATGAPKAAHDNTIYFNLRYTLPGSIPNF